MLLDDLLDENYIESDLRMLNLMWWLVRTPKDFEDMLKGCEEYNNR